MPDMEPIDIWRSAQLMVKQYGLFAPQQCRQRADALAAKGNCNGEAVWEAVRRAAERLLENGPPGDIPGLRN
jgi:hypothetical protein